MLLISLLGCVPDDPTPSSVACRAVDAIVTDIDETLTTSDSEYLQQLIDPTHDPAMRPDADALMQGYADRGYAIVYITARGEDAVLGDGRDAREATADWLLEHGFPLEPAHLFLADGLGTAGDGAIAYKSGAMQDLTAEGLSFAWGYGNAETDIEGFRLGGLDDAHLFLVGELAGTMGVQPLPDEEAYTAHLPWLDDVAPGRCE